MRLLSRAGFTLIELLISIGVLALLAAISWNALYTTDSRDSLSGDSQRVLSEVNEARSLTVASKSGQPWGVHFASTTVTLFEGTSYVAGSSTNVVTDLNGLDQISSISLQGGGSNVIFEQFSGETTDYGTTTLSLVASSSEAAHVVIYKTGVAVVQ